MTYQTVNPATGETEATFAGTSDTELDAALAAARAGLEDALYLRKGEFSAGNQPLVERAVNLAAALDRPVASVEEAAALLRLPPR